MNEQGSTDNKKTTSTSKVEKPKKDYVKLIKDTIEKWKLAKQKKGEELAVLKGKKIGKLSKVTSASKAPKELLYNPFSWIKQFFFWSNAQVAIVVIAAVLVWCIVYAIKDRNLVVIELPLTLEQRVFDTYKQNNFDRDQVDRFVVGALTIMRSFDFRGQPNLPLLKGIVNPDILAKVSESYATNKENVERVGMIQVLAPPQVNTLFLEEELVNKNKRVKRAQVYVSGYLSITTLPKGKSQFTKIVPYRAQVQLVRMPTSKISRADYYITEISEVAGEDQVKRFDEILRREKQKRGLD